MVRAVTWAWTWFHCVWVAALVVAILVAAGVDVETPIWNAVRATTFVVSMVALAVLGVNWWRNRRGGRETDVRGHDA